MHRTPPPPPTATPAAATRSIESWAGWLHALRRSCTCFRCRRFTEDFARDLRDRDYPLHHPARWLAAHFGFLEPRAAAPRAFLSADHQMARLRKASRRSRKTALVNRPTKGLNPALLPSFLDESARHRGSDLEEAKSWLDLAAWQAKRLRLTDCPRVVLDAAEVRIEAHRANLHRIAGDLSAAATIFDRLAGDRRRLSIARPGDEAELLRLEGSLRVDRREFAQAERNLEAAEFFYRTMGDEPGTIKTLIKRSSAAAYAGAVELGLQFIRTAADLADATVNLPLWLRANQNLANRLIDLGRSSEAAALLDRHADLFARYDGPADALRLGWARARIAEAEGRLDEAEALFTKVREGWLHLERYYDAALVTLEAAALHLRQGHWSEVRHLAAALAPVFKVRGVHREALAALGLFREAAAGEALDAVTLARLRRYLLFAQADPAYRYDEGDPLLAGGCAAAL